MLRIRDALITLSLMSLAMAGCARVGTTSTAPDAHPFWGGTILDPVCGMWLSHEAAWDAQKSGDQTFGFCMEVCREVYHAHPEAYTGNHWAKAQIVAGYQINIHLMTRDAFDRIRATGHIGEVSPVNVAAHTHHITVRVMDGFGVPVMGASVTVESDSGAVSDTESDGGIYEADITLGEIEAVSVTVATHDGQRRVAVLSL
jgi:YHS domain-containing protein